MDVQDDIIMALSNEMVERGPRMVAEYDASKPTVTFPEWAATYQVEHHLPYDLSIWASCIMPLNDPRRKQHDGILEGRNPYKVEHMFGPLRPAIASVKIGHEEVSDDEIWLSPKQALSLLAWLKQEEAVLVKLAEKQAEVK